MSKSFEEFVKSLKETNIIPSYYYTDYEVVSKHQGKFASILDLYPAAINSKEEFIKCSRDIFNKDKSMISIIPLFSGVRPDKLTVISDEGATVKKFNEENVSFDESMEFLETVGFLDKIEGNKPLNLKSYFYGINVGLDSNGRKNRGGKQMEKLVGSYIQKTSANYLEQTTFSDINDSFGTSYVGITEKVKRFDFAIQSKSNKTILIETNFFNSSGSKTDINTRFIKLRDTLKTISPNIVFVVITDGIGLKKAMLEIKDVYQNIKHVYNIDDLENGIMDLLVNL